MHRSMEGGLSGSLDRSCSVYAFSRPLWPRARHSRKRARLDSFLSPPRRIATVLLQVGRRSGSALQIARIVTYAQVPLLLHSIRPPLGDPRSHLFFPPPRKALFPSHVWKEGRRDVGDSFNFTMSHREPWVDRVQFLYCTRVVIPPKRPQLLHDLRVASRSGCATYCGADLKVF